LKGRHDDDGYELLEPLVLSALSTHEAIFVMVAADPDQGTVTVQRSGTDEYWIFPMDRVASMSQTDFEFLMPERLNERQSKKRVAAICVAVSAVLLAAFAGVHASTDLAKKPLDASQNLDADRGADSATK